MANAIEIGGGGAAERACRVLKNCGYYISGNRFQGNHNGIDIMGAGGQLDDIVAHTGGVVIAAESGYGNLPGSSGFPAFGNYVEIKHASGYRTLYAHMDSISVSKGQKVNKGQKLGRMGNTGNSYGTHLHFEVRRSDGSRINPVPYLTANLPGGSSSGSSGGSSGSSGGGKTTVEVTRVEVVSTQGANGVRGKGSLAETSLQKTGAEILIQNGRTIMLPVLADSITLEWSRKGSPGTLRFTCIKDAGLSFTEGNPVSFRMNEKNVFYGYVFEKSRGDAHKITVTCYDQLRYLKNRGTIAYANKKYSELLTLLAKDYGLTCGTVEDSGYVIGQRIEDGSLFDILGNASDQTLANKGKLFVLYDDFGKLCLTNSESMALPILIDEETAEGYNYLSSIDQGVYTKVVLAQDNNESGVRELYVANNETAQKNWGILQYYEAQNDLSAAELKESAKLLLDRYGTRRKTLRLTKCFGDIRVRAGSSLVVKLKLEDTNIENYMMVERVRHSFSKGRHVMDLELSGIKGEFVV